MIPPELIAALQNAAHALSEFCGCTDCVGCPFNVKSTCLKAALDENLGQLVLCNSHKDKHINKLIRLTDPEGRPCFVSASAIKAVVRNHEDTVTKLNIEDGDTPIFVIETPEWIGEEQAKYNK